MRRAIVLSLAFHGFAASALILGALPPDRGGVDRALPVAKVELLQQNSSAVAWADGTAEPSPPAATARSPGPAAPPALDGAADAPAMIASASDSAILSGTGLVSGPNVIPAAPDSRLQNMPPAYPRESARLGEAGTVALLIHVASDGVPTEVDITGSSGFRRLDAAARVAVGRWHFRPAVQDGVPVASELPMRVIFALKGPSHDRAY